MRLTPLKDICSEYGASYAKYRLLEWKNTTEQ
jgi:hypothetical protein